MNELATIDHSQMSLSADQIRSQVNLIQEVMASVMKKDTHYGKIPGTTKNTLYKAGAEVLLTTFRIAVEPDVEDLSTSDEIRYRIHARGIHQSTGVVVGIGVGECSSNEEKYKWVAAVCQEQFEATDVDRRRIAYKKKKYPEKGHYTVDQIRAEPADIANTILKMAKKRAQIDLCLTATAASDIFTQDIEDLTDGLRNNIADDNRDIEVKQPQSKSAKAGSGENPATEKQRKMVFARSFNGGINMDLFREKFGEIDDLQSDQINGVLKWITDNKTTEQAS